jgi:hypothetical protein
MNNNRNYKNPTARAWEELRLMFQSFSDRMKQYDSMAERQGRDIGIDEVYNEIKNVRQQLDKIQRELNLHNNTINNERVLDKSQSKIPFNINRKDESIQRKKDIVRLTEGDLHRIIKNCIHEALENAYDYDEYLSKNSNADSIDLDDTDIAAICRKFVPNEPVDNYRKPARFYKSSVLQK